MRPSYARSTRTRPRSERERYSRRIGRARAASRAATRGDAQRVRSASVRRRETAPRARTLSARGPARETRAASYAARSASVRRGELTRARELSATRYSVESSETAPDPWRLARPADLPLAVVAESPSGERVTVSYHRTRADAETARETRATLAARAPSDVRRARAPRLHISRGESRRAYCGALLAEGFTAPADALTCERCAGAYRASLARELLGPNARGADLPARAQRSTLSAPSGATAARPIRART